MYFRSKNQSRNRFRWYRIQIQHCLFGGVDLVCSWGRIGWRGGQIKSSHFEDVASALEMVRCIEKVRQSHGYQKAQEPSLQLKIPLLELPKAA